MSALRNFTFTTFCVLLVVKGLSSAPVNVPLTSVSNLLIQTALNSLNESSPNHHTYQNGELISAQKLEESPFTIYRLTFNLDPTCDEKSVRPKEACTLEVKQHEGGAVSVNRDSIQCLYLHPQSQPLVPNHDQELIDSLEKQIGDNIKLDHEVQTSADHNDRPFIAVPANKSPYCPGCPYDLNPRNLPGVSAFVDQIVQSMDESLAGDFKHTAITILRISRSVPPNANVVRYEFLLLIAETSCLKTSLVERTECSLQSGTPIKRCLVTLEEKPWQENSRVITKNNCTGTNLENELNSSVGPSFSPENTPSGNNSPGSGLSQEGDEDSKTEFYDQVAQEGKFSTYETMPNQYFESPTLNLTVEGDDGNIKRVVVEEPAKKVVLDKDDVQEKKEGFADRMKEFDSFLKEFDVLVRDMTPNEDQRIPVVEDVIKPVKIESGAQSEEKNGKGCSKKRIESIRVKRDMGNEDLVVVQDELLVKKLARKAIAILDDIDSDSMKRIVLKVLQAKKENEKTNQVNYYLKLKVATTTCSEGELDLAEERRCLEDAINPARICKIQLSTSEENPLLAPKIIESACIDFSEEVKTRRRREILVGGSTKKDVNDPKIQKYAQLGLQEYAKNLDSSYEPLIAKITDAKVQVVSGILYKIKVQFGNSNCRKGEIENCQLQSDGELKECLIKAWSQPWLDNDNPKVTVDCEPNESKGSDNLDSRHPDRNVVVNRKKRSLPGGITPMSVSDPDIQNYAKLGLQQYSQGLQSSNEPVIAKIVEASSQVVSGMLYRIKVQFGNSDCPKGQTENCLLQSDSELKECDIEAWSQPWLDKGDPKITVKCGTERSKRSTDADQKELDKEQASLERTFDLPVDIDDEVKKDAQDGLKKYAETSESPYEPLIAKITQATNNDDAEVKKVYINIGDSNCKKGQKQNCKLQSGTKLKKCVIRITNDQTGRKVEAICEHSKKSEKKSDKVKSKRRHEAPPEGETPMDVKDPDTEDFAYYGLKKYSQIFKSSYEPIIAKIIKASSSKHDDETHYKFEVQIGDSDCRKGNNINCQLQPHSKLRECALDLVMAPWVYNEPLKAEVSCKPAKKSPEKSEQKSDEVKSRPRREALLGGTTPMDVNNPDIQNYAKLGLQQYSRGLQNSNEPVIARIVEASSQVVSGMLYRIKVQFGNSDCPKGQTENCQLQSDSDLKECDIEAWSQPWLDKGEPKITVKCGAERSKRSTDADQKELDKEQDWLERMYDAPIDIDDEVKKDAQNGLKKYAETSQSPYEPLIAKITQATDNGDAEVKKIYFNIGDSNCKKGQKHNCKLQSGTKLKKCGIRITNDQTGRKVETICEPSKESEKKSDEVKSKGHDALPGPTTPMDINDPDTLDIAYYVLKKYPPIFKSSSAPIISKIIKASSSKHDGETHYKFEVQIGDSDCSEEKVVNCKLTPHPKLRECMLEIVMAPWIFPGPSAVTVDCKPVKKSPEKSEQKSDEVKSRPRREALLGGTTPMDVNNPDIQTYAKLGLQQYSRGLQSSNEPVIAKIVEASSQVVSGMLYRIKVQFGNSDCPKGQTENCQLQSDSELKECDIEAWSQPWLDKGEPKITVRCGAERSKRSVDKEADEEEFESMYDMPIDIDDQVKKDAQDGLKKYAETSESPYEPLIAKITQATDNNDACVKKVYVKIGDSTCKKGQKHNCRLQPNTKLTACVIRITNDQDGRKVENICEHSKKSAKKSEKNSDEGKSKPRHEALSGGTTPMDVTDSEAQSYPNYGLDKYSQIFKSSHEPIIAKVIKASYSKHDYETHYKFEVQIGDSDCPKGKNDYCKLQSHSKLRDCMLDIVVAPWVYNAPLKVEVNCKSPEKSEQKSDEVKSRPRREALLGGTTPMDVNNPDIQNYAKLGLQQYSRGLQTSNEPVIARIVEASSQVVSGMLYRIKVQFGNSDCPKGQTENCQPQSDSELKECDIEAWSQPWLDKGKPKITVTCGSERSKRSTDEDQKGSETSEEYIERTFDMPVDIDDEVKKNAQLGLKKYAETSESPYEPLIAKITQAIDNDDAGVKKVYVNIGDSNCKKGHKHNCKLQSGTKLKKCVIRISDDQTGERVETICEHLKKSPKKSEKNSDKVKSKRGYEALSGGTTPIDVNDSAAKDYANYGLDKYSQIFKSSHEPIIAKIIKASYSKHDDEKHYKFEVQIGDSDCTKGKHDYCTLQSHSKLRDCMLDIVIVPWVYNAPLKAEVNCKPPKKSPEKSEQKSDEVKPRPRREALLGGTTPMDVNNPDIQNYAKLGLQQYSQSLQSANEPVIAKIVEASSQVVSGMLYRIKVQFGNSNCPKGQTGNCQLQSDSELKECDIEAWSQPWLDKGEPKITVKCGAERRKRSMDAEKEDEYFEKMFDSEVEIDDQIKKDAQLGLKIYAKTSKSPYEPLIAKITHATMNADAMVEKITVKFGDSNCKKGQTQHCKLQPDTKLKECVIRISDAPYGDKKDEKVTVVCKPSKKSPKKSENKSKDVKSRRRREALPGGTTPIDVNDSDIQNYAKLGLQQYSQSLQSANEPVIAKIVEASSQVVSGMLYRIKVQFGNSDCPKGQTGNCQLQSDSELKECDIEAWSQPWLDKGEPKIKVTCGSNRTRRSLRGQNYSQKMLQQAEEMKEEENTGQSEKDNLQGENYSQKMLRQAEEIKAERMKDLVSEERSLRGQNYNQKMLKQAGEMKDEILEAEQLFRDFVEEFRKVYSNDEEKQKRLGIFRENLKKIEELRRYEEGTGEYGVTNFTDLTTEEFRSNYLGLRPELKSENEIPFPMAEIPDVSLPTEFDWRKKNAVTGVKDQGSCGSCWAFSVTGNIEGQYAIKHGELLSFSEQELVDCDKLDEGCNGGLPDSAYRALEKLGGLETESDYPYDAEDETCHFSKSKIKVKVVSAVNITSNETKMAQWLVQNGPISIGINANAMQFYIGGISHPPKFLCDPKNLDHGVLIVGFGVHTYPIFKKTLPFWIVKNSWGPRWGERGYYRVYRGGSTCGVNQMASSAIVA